MTFFLFFPENRIRHSMQIVSIGETGFDMSNGDNLHEMSSPVFWENKKNIVNLSSADLA